MAHATALIPRYIIILLFLLPCIAPGQDGLSSLRSGFSVQLSYPVAAPSFFALPGVEKAPGSTNYSMAAPRPAYGGSLFARMSFLSFLSGGLRLQYTTVPAGFTAEEKIPYIDAKGDPAIATNVYTLNIEYLSFGLQPEVYLHLPGSVSLSLGAQLALSGRSSFVQSARIKDPGGPVLVGSPEDSSGNIPGFSSLLYSLSAGLHYELALSRNFSVCPEIVLRQDLNSPVQGADLRFSSIQAGISLVFAPFVHEELASIPVELPVYRDTTIVLVDRDVKEEIVRVGGVSISSSAIREHYERRIHKPLPLLSVQLRAKISSQGREFDELSIPLHTVRRCSYTPDAVNGFKESCDTVTYMDSLHIQFIADIIHEAPLRDWEIRVFRGGNEIRTFSGSGEPPAVVEWHTESIPAGEALSYRMKLNDSEGQSMESGEGKILFDSGNPGAAPLRVRKYFLQAAESKNLFLRRNKAMLEHLRGDMNEQRKIILRTPDRNYGRMITDFLSLAPGHLDIIRNEFLSASQIGGLPGQKFTGERFIELEVQER